MDSRNSTQLKTAGITFIAAGIPFLGLAAVLQPAFSGVGCAFLALGIVFLARSRKQRRQQR